MTTNKLKIASSQASINKNYLKVIQGIQQLAIEKPLPSDIEMEAAVLGAILTDKEAFNIVRDILKRNHFYSEAHQIIFNAMEQLEENKNPIDLLTTRAQLKKTRNLEKVGGVNYLVELTNRVASTANTEAHSRIIYQTFLMRDGIKQCAGYLKKFYEGTRDIFELRNELADDLQVMPPKSLFKVTDFNKAIIEGEKAPKLSKLCGTLFNKTEVCIFFGPPGTGKSIFAIQLANALSRGEDFIPGTLVNECDPQKVLYVDFELTGRNLKARYSDDQDKNNFVFETDMLVRASMDDDFLDFDDRLDKIAQRQIERIITKVKPDVMIVDNITFLTSESNHDTEIAKKLMKKLVFYKRKYNLSLFVIAHTTKSFSKFLPLEQKDMAGSAQLQNFADSMFGIKMSALDKRIKYLKQFKDRNEPEVLTDENVLVIESTKIGEQRNFLSFEYRGFAREIEHLAVPENDDQALDDLIAQATKIKAEEYLSYRELAKEIGWKRSLSSLAAKVKDYAENDINYRVTKRGQIVINSPENRAKENEKN